MRTPKLTILDAAASQQASSFVKAYNWTECKIRVERIINGTLVLDSITKDNVSQFLYHGPVPGLHPSFHRPDYRALTLDGCRKICGNPIDIFEAPQALSVAATWVFPLAILFSLPWESLHEKKVSKTLAAASNWLGSPQTALTATIFNFRGIRNCHRRVRRVGFDNWITRHYSNALYVLSVLNQFDGLETHVPSNNPRDSQPTRMLNVLIYGLFRPLSAQDESDVRHTRQLLSDLAHQLRILRRKGVLPTLASLGTFLVAFIFSLVLTFAELGDDNTPFALSFGLLLSWLPPLVIFTIVDRNPISADRSGELISRWLFNVDAVMSWAQGDNPRQIVYQGAEDPEDIQTIDNIRWWRPQGLPEDNMQVAEQPLSQLSQIELRDLGRPQVNHRAQNEAQTQNHPWNHVGEFIGQGRQLKYCGLVHAVLMATDGAKFSHLRDNDLLFYARKTAINLSRRKPRSWYVVAVLSFLLVWCEIMMAFMVAFCSPTVGLGCRSLSYLLFGILSSISWFIHLPMEPSKCVRWILHFFNGLAIISLIGITGAQLTGVMNNCYCKSSALSMPGIGGYMDFENAAFYRDHFNSGYYWGFAAVIGGAIPLITFLVALFWWMKCKHLWSANEKGQGSFGNSATERLWLG
ncbi:hypothetical protein F53441_325 [Fusarium austroafricanum]|uniref:Uncharacterized protein n=1 Tax=Fusarium austroafricanum TaxID=2364996 RepID=A0A8H4KX22_9HYPO|nr:hypothetical protein F53441_325 [Fusarium austroafricanum]